MKLSKIADTILDQGTPRAQLEEVLRGFSEMCSAVSGVEPSPSFDAWAEDTFLANGVAINSRAAAHCVTDYRRTVVFLRGVFAALTQAVQQFSDVPVKVLYAGCGPYATLLLPLLGRFDADRLDITLLDYHQQSLDGVARLIEFFEYGDYRIKLLQADACDYQSSQPLHLIIAETMQKSLEQEPQFAITANLAPQLSPGGTFIPHKIEVELCLASREGGRVPLATVLTLTSDGAETLDKTALQNKLTGKRELSPVLAEIPLTQATDGFDALFFTRIQVFSEHWLADHEAEITLPSRCTELSPVKAGERWAVSYQLGNYPKFSVVKA
jgi:hypothetical protein